MRQIIRLLRVVGKISGLVLYLVIVQFFIASSVGAAEDSPVRLDWASKAFPALAIQGDDFSRYPNGQPAAFRGFADPCLRRDPLTGDVWLAYSWPHMEHLGGTQQNFAVGVESHLAVSKDGGKTWQRTQVLWPKTPARFTKPKARKARDGLSQSRGAKHK